MSRIHWIRFDIPFQPDATKMRAVYAFGEDSIQTGISSFEANIPQILEALKADFAKAGHQMDAETIFVCPLDGRNQLAWVVKEAAEEKGCKYARHITHQTEEIPTPFEVFETGSQEDDLTAQDAQSKIFQHNNEARDAFTASDMPIALNHLRHALQLTHLHFGWTSPGMVYCLTNFSYVLRGTGNPDNIKEAAVSVKRMLMAWEKEAPEPQEWAGAASLLEQLVNVCNALDLTDSANSLKEWMGKLS